MRNLRFAFCFDDAYALPAAVSLHSLMSHAVSPDVRYELNVVADGLGDDAKAMLRRAVAPFPQASLVFRSPPPLPGALCGTAARKSHYSDALFHKLLLPGLFGAEGRVVALDVDTVYCGDAARLHDAEFRGCLAGAREPMYFGWRGEGPLAGKAKKVRRYFREYSAAERARMTLNAGIIVYDLAEIAASGAVGKWVDFALRNVRRLLLPEQDVFNLALDAPPAPLDWDVCAYAPIAPRISPESPPLQIHYTTKVKPWLDPGCNLADRWFEALASAGLVEEWRRLFAAASRGMYRDSRAKRLFSFEAGRLRLSLVKYGKRRT